MEIKIVLVRGFVPADELRRAWITSPTDPSTQLPVEGRIVTTRAVMIDGALVPGFSPGYTQTSVASHDAIEEDGAGWWQHVAGHVFRHPATGEFAIVAGSPAMVTACRIALPGEPGVRQVRERGSNEPAVLVFDRDGNVVTYTTFPTDGSGPSAALVAEAGEADAVRHLVWPEK